MSTVSTEEQADLIVISVAPIVQTINDSEGMQILSEEGLPITISVDDTNIEITAEGIEVEAADISLTAEAGVEIEAGADFDLSVGGAAEVETGDVSVTAGAVEFESVLFTVG